VRPEVTILSDIGRALLKDSPVDFAQFKTHRTIRQAIARVVPGMEQLEDIDVAKREFHINGRLLHAPQFKTPDHRARFIVTDLPTGPDAQLREDYPFQLMTVRSEGQFNTMIYEEDDSYRGTTSRWSVLMNRDDIARLGLEVGAQADLRSPHGSMAAVEVYAFDLPPGNAMAYFPEANVLIGRESDPRSKTPAFKSVAIDITRTVARASASHQ
jgi:anaerobic selenocysteine-containing dehydrogenase